LRPALTMSGRLGSARGSHFAAANRPTIDALPRNVALCTQSRAVVRDRRPSRASRVNRLFRSGNGSATRNVSDQDARLVAIARCLAMASHGVSRRRGKSRWGVKENCDDGSDERRPYAVASFRRTSSLTVLPSTLCPASFAIAAFITRPMSLADVAPVSEIASTTARSIATGSTAGGR
jgi:hypothetical protein